MPARPLAVRLTLLWLVVTVILPADATPSGTKAGNSGATLPVEIDGRTIQVAVPAGMSYAEELLPMYAGFARNMGADARAVFWSDSSLAALRAGQGPDDFRVAGALVTVFKGDLARTADQVRGYFAYEWTNREKILRSSSTDTAEYARVQGVLRKDPEGRDDISLPLKPGSKVGLAIHHLEDRASIQLQVSSLPGQSAGGPVSLSILRAQAAVIVRDRVIGMFLMRNLRPTTRAVADLNRDFQAWVQGTLAANNDEAPGVSGTADSLESYPKFGEYMFVEVLPQAVRKVPPEYPDAARSAGVSGTVMVQALIGRDGRVKDTRIVQSIPALDRHAVAAVRQWEFNPAQLEGKPVAVWVAIPVMFTLR